jgi:imidazole glycerol phosphate synthase subunit HisF|tara:strand:- start:387 stop:740 length:354 start_codon:yes stop_codon:yes gene_type:complete
MATMSKVLLSGSTQGKGIKVGQTATAGDTIHTAVAGTSDIDEIWLYAVNSSAAAVKLTLEWGEATAPDGNIEVTVDGEAGLVLLTPGLLLQNGLVVKAFAGTTNVILIHGFVNRISA